MAGPCSARRARTGVPVGQPREPLVEADLRPPAEDCSRTPLIEPVRGRPAVRRGTGSGEGSERRAGRGPRSLLRRHRPARPRERAVALVVRERRPPGTAALSMSADRQGSPLETTSASPCAGPHASTAATRAAAALSTYVVSMSAAPEPMIGQSAAPGPLDDPRHQLPRRPGPHTRWGRTTSTESAAESAAQRLLLGHRLWTAPVGPAPAPAPDRRDPPPPRTEGLRRAQPMGTTRAPSRSHAAGDTQPATNVPRSLDVGPRVLVPPAR